MNSPTTRRLIVASDLHYGLGRNSRTKLGILKNFVEPAILNRLSDDGTDTLVICGDLFHEMVSVRTDIYKDARIFLSKCAKKAHVVLLAGNHDCFDDSTEVTSVELFDQMDNVEVVRFPKETVLCGRTCVFLPWSDNNAYAFDKPEGEYDFVFCHPDVPKEFFRGVYVLENSRRLGASEANRRALEKDELLRTGLDEMNFSDGKEEERLGRANDRVVSNLESVRRVITLAKEGGDIFAGHVHKHSESMILGRTFRFVGAPYQTTSEEIDSKSGIYVVDENGVTFEEIRAPEYVRVKFSEVKRLGVDGYDFSHIGGNIVQFDADDVISVELEAMLKRRIVDEKPYEISDTDYSNLVIEEKTTEISEDYEKAFSNSPKNCVDLYIGNIPDEEFQTENVSREKILSTFDAVYDNIERRNGAVVTEGGANIKYKRLEASNFLSYDSLEFDFLKYRGLTLIYGKNLDNLGATNACGKSNLIKAIVYALFGRFPKKVKKENMSSWIDPSKDVNVSIFLESNGVNYRIDSGLRRGKDSYHRITNLDDGTDLTKKQIAETRKFIESEILHCSFDMFMKTTVLTSSEIFNFYCMKKEDKDDYLNTIFGTKTLNEVREQIKTFLKDERTRYMEESRLLESKEHDISLNRTASEKFEQNRAESIKSIEGEIDELRRKISVLEAEDSSKSNDDFAKYSEEVARLNKQISESNARIRSLKSELQTAERSVEKNSTTIKLMTKELSKHKDVVPQLCESCKKVVAKGYKLSDYAKTIKKAQGDMERESASAQELRKSLSAEESARDELVRSCLSAEQNRKNASTNSSEITRLENVIESKKSTINYISSQVNPNSRIIENLDAERAAIADEVEAILSRIRHLDFIQLKVVSQEVITNLLTSRFIQQLNDRIRYYLQRLGLNLGVTFDNDFHYEFNRGDGAHPEFNSLSGGESLRIVIATSFAFKDFLESRRNISANIRFLDEFFEKDTDNLGMNSTISILKDFSRLMNQNVFLISNKLNEIDGSVFDNTLVVNIKDSRSFIVEEAL